jgi:regulator of cell morphogenesis and NO signaling
MENTSRFNFSEWPLDLLVDYVLKVHHRRVREKGPGTLSLINKVMMENLVLDEVEQLFSQSLSDLDTHLMKEERVLFPYILDLYDAVRSGQPIAPMHCGTVRNPINVMMSDHDAELQRHERIATLLNDYQAPADASEDYKELMRQLSEFRENLKEHTHVENDIIFPKAIEMEASRFDGQNL